MMYEASTIFGSVIAVSAMIFASVSGVLADVAPPPSQAEGIDWTYVISGAACGIAGALIFVWIGRKFSKR